MEAIDRIHAFWFGPIADGWITEDRQALWWEGGDATDAQIRDEFGELHNQANAGALQSWADDARGRLALIILLDQFSRNIHRKTKLAFSCDHKALQLTMDGIARGHDVTLKPVERAFFYMPLMHCETLKNHDLAAQLYRDLVDMVPEPNTERAANFVKGAKQHRDLIERFGRYPHRNDVLGRKSTPEEIEFLATLEDRFGQ